MVMGIRTDGLVSVALLMCTASSSASSSLDCAAGEMRLLSQCPPIDAWLIDGDLTSAAHIMICSDAPMDCAVEMARLEAVECIGQAVDWGKILGPALDGCQCDPMMDLLSYSEYIRSGAGTVYERDIASAFMKYSAACAAVDHNYRAPALQNLIL